MSTPALATLFLLGGLVIATMAWLVAARRRLAADVTLFSRFMHHGPFLAYLKDADGRYVYENQAVRDHIARVRPGTTTTVGRTDRDLFVDTVGTLYVDHDRTVVQQGQPSQFAEMSVDADGTVRHWSSMKFLWQDDRGRPCIAGISIDVTALTQARTDAQSSEDRCRLALEAGHMGSMSLNLETMILDTTPVFAVVHGNPETLTHISFAEAIERVHSDDRPALMEALQATLHDEGPHRVRYRVIKPDGTVAWIELVGNACRDETGRPSIIRAVGCDVTERQRDFEELARRRDMLRRLIDVQENERQLLCHEIHDGPIQYAIAAKMHLESARDDDDATVRNERIEAALDCLARGIAEGRQVIRGVRPAVLDDLGLTAAIEDLVEQMAAAGITVEATLGGALDALPHPLQTTIYRIVQESLTNARKHSGVDRVTVEILRVGDEVSLCVRDEGAGFDVDECRRQGFGLVGMTERVRLAGGTFALESRPGGGTQIRVLLPIPAAAYRPDSAGDSAAYAAAVPVFPAR